MTAPAHTRGAGPHRLITEWSSPDPLLADMLRSIEAEPAHSILRLELEAALHQFQARLCYDRIGRLRAAEQDRARRKSRASRGHQVEEVIDP